MNRRLLIIVALSSIFASQAHAELHRVPVHTSQIAKLSQLVTGVPKFVVPLLIAVDSQGKIVGHGVKWKNGEVDLLAERARTAGDGPELKEALKAAGIEPPDAVELEGPALVVLSMPAVCPPCAGLDSLLIERASARHDVSFVVLVSEPSALPRPQANAE